MNSHLNHFEINPDQSHDSYEKFQQEKFGNVLPVKKRWEENAEQLENKYDLILDFSNND